MSYHNYRNPSCRYNRVLLAMLFFIGLKMAVEVASAELPLQRIELHPIQTVTRNTTQFLTGEKQGIPNTIAGELRLPLGVTDRMPAVVLVHGSIGITIQIDPWARMLNELGIAVFIIDSFTGRGFGEGFVPGSRVGSLAMIVDVYRALELLAKHPRIDPSRIALMGFSRGGMWPYMQVSNDSRTCMAQRG